MFGERYPKRSRSALRPPRCGLSSPILAATRSGTRTSAKERGKSPPTADSPDVPAQGQVTVRPKVLTAEPGVELRLAGRLPGIFSGEHYFTLSPVPAGTRAVQSEVYRGIIVPFLGKIITASQLSFRAHNQALKEVEAQAR